MNAQPMTDDQRPATGNRTGSTVDAPPPPDGAPAAGIHRKPFISPGMLRLLAALGLVFALSAAIVHFRDQLAGLGAYGYPGLFVFNLVASASLFLPVPGLALACAAGTSFQPLLVGLSTGLGSALGEMTGYLAGVSGRGVIANQASYERVRGWMERRGLWVIFILSLIPNPLFDAAGIAAGVMHIPVWQYLLACATGKAVKGAVLAYACLGGLSLLQDILSR